MLRATSRLVHRRAQPVQPGRAAPALQRAPDLPGPDRPPSERPLPGVAAVMLAQLPPAGVPWALWRLARGPRLLREVPGLRFARVLGSGRGGGFGLRPGFDRAGLFAMFDGTRDAEDFLAGSPLVQGYRRRAREFCTAVLLATHCRGSWSGQAMQPLASERADAPVAALTRASIRPGKAWTFWRHAAPAQAALVHASACRLAAGLGEAPLLRQATFSVWDSSAAMEAYARHGAHHEAAATAMREGCFSECMFVRFVPLSLRGTWQGRHHG
jgi:spheroidene monooxygenase